MVDLVHSHQARGKFELLIVRQGSDKSGGQQLTMLFLSEITINCAFFVLSLIYDATIET